MHPFASGSELQHALRAAEELGSDIRVVSLPCFERFARQSAEYQESVLPKACRNRVSIEAGVSDPWFRYVGTKVMEILGMTPASVVKAVNALCFEQTLA
jgi:transketolase